MSVTSILPVYSLAKTIFFNLYPQNQFSGNISATFIQIFKITTTEFCEFLYILDEIEKINFWKPKLFTDLVFPIWSS